MVEPLVNAEKFLRVGANTMYSGFSKGRYMDSHESAKYSAQSVEKKWSKKEATVAIEKLCPLILP